MPFDELSEGIVAVSMRKAIVLILLFQKPCDVSEDVLLIESVDDREVGYVGKYRCVVLLVSDYFTISSVLLANRHQLLKLKRSFRGLKCLKLRISKHFNI